jgi:DNA-binding protein H-NS
MNNLIDIQSQIEKLQKQASDIKAKEFDKTVLDILAMMQAFGITAKDLQVAMARRAKGRPAAGSRRAPVKTKKTSAAKVAAKYRGPSGETWSGRGLTPRWLTALVAQGKAKEDFAVKD